MFLRREVVRDYSFDESLGVGAGTPWGAGEETDYLLRLLEDGHRIFYDPAIAIWHQGRSGPYTSGTFAEGPQLRTGNRKSAQEASLFAVFSRQYT